MAGMEGPGGWVLPANLMTAAEVAAVLRAPSVRTVGRLRRAGELPGVLVGRSYLFDRRDVRGFVERKRKEAGCAER